MPRKGLKPAGSDALPTLDTSAEVSERDLTEGERRKSGVDVKRGRRFGRGG